MLPQLAVMPQEEMLGGGRKPPAADEHFAGFRKPPPVQPPQMQPMQAQAEQPKPAKQQPAQSMPPPQGMEPPRGFTPPPIRAPEVGTQAASAGQFDVQQFRPFADAVYSEATRQLDPMMQQREADFRQRMVNQGLQEGTEAFDKAFANFSRERNDAYGSARNQALAQALGAQNQFFGQSATNAQMANQMGLANAQMGQQAEMANASNWLSARGLGEGARQFNQNFAFGRERADMQDLMSLLGYGQQATAFNNSQLAQDQQRAMALFGLIPGLTPTQLDVMGPANGFMNAQAANANAAASRSNGMFGALGQIGAAFISDIRAKTDIQRVGVLDNGLPVYLYRYKSGGPFHIGVMAQEVEQVKPDAVGEVNGIKFVNYAEAVK